MLSRLGHRTKYVFSLFEEKKIKFKKCTRAILHGKKLGHCNRLLKTGCNNVVGATLFLVVNDIVRHCHT